VQRRQAQCHRHLLRWPQPRCLDTCAALTCFCTEGYDLASVGSGAPPNVPPQARLSPCTRPSWAALFPAASPAALPTCPLLCAHVQRKIAGYERRPIVILRKRLLSKVLNAWCVRVCACRRAGGRVYFCLCAFCVCACVHVLACVC